MCAGLASLQPRSRTERLPVSAGGECGVPTHKRFQMPGSPQEYWYSFDLGPVHFLQYNTELDFAAGSAQNECAPPAAPRCAGCHGLCLCPAPQRVVQHCCSWLGPAPAPQAGPQATSSWHGALLDPRCWMSERIPGRWQLQQAVPSLLCTRPLRRAGCVQLDQGRPGHGQPHADALGHRQRPPADLPQLALWRGAPERPGGGARPARRAGGRLRPAPGVLLHLAGGALDGGGSPCPAAWRCTKGWCTELAQGSGRHGCMPGRQRRAQRAGPGSAGTGCAA